MINDEYINEDIDDEKTVEYIKNALPVELKEKYSDDTLYYILDVINDYFTNSGVLDQVLRRDAPPHLCPRSHWSVRSFRQPRCRS